MTKYLVHYRTENYDATVTSEWYEFATKADLDEWLARCDSMAFHITVYRAERIDLEFIRGPQPVIGAKVKS